MGTKYGGQIVTDGLMLAADMKSTNSYRGPAIKNRLAYIWAIHYGVQNAYFSGRSGIADVYIPGLNRTIPSKFCEIQNNYPSSTSCCPTTYGYGNYGDIRVTGGNTYTYMLVDKDEAGYYSTNFMYRYEYNKDNSGIYEIGVYDGSKRNDLGNGWVWAYNTFTTNAATSGLSCHSFYYSYSLTPDRHWVAQAGLFDGDLSSMHPNLWPEVGTTRAKENALLDLTKKNTFVLTKPQYDKSGYLTFAGSAYIFASGSYLDVGTKDFTHSIWVKFSSIAGTQRLTAKRYPALGYGYSYAMTNSEVYFEILTTTSYVILYSGPLSAGVWYNITATIDRNGLGKLYLNGRLVDSEDYSAFAGLDITNGFNLTIGDIDPSIGGAPFYGQIPIILNYNRALSHQEVLQNYNSHKGRFGL